MCDHREIEFLLVFLAEVGGAFQPRFAAKPFTSSGETFSTWSCSDTTDGASSSS
jgi:hypothetical protein